MFALAPADYARARPLFAPLLSTQMFCAGVLAGLYPGQVFVDDTDQPQSGVVTKDGVWWFLAGRPDNAAFNAALHTAIFDRTLSGEQGFGGMLVCHPAGWEAAMPALYAPRTPITTQRRHYTCRHVAVDWRAQVPAGMELRFVDESLAADGIDVQGAAAKVLALRQAAPTKLGQAADPDQAAVGFVAVHAGRIVASSVIDCIVEQGGDIGLYTDGDFRRRGLAYLTAAAVLEYALAHGVAVVHWDCEAYNFGSIRTAEKLGLEFSHAHTLYTLILNPVLHEVNRAWSHFDAGRYAEALAVCEQSAAAGPEAAHPHLYYVQARCELAGGDADAAAHSLALAAQAGWDAPEEAQADFQALAQHAAWPGLLARMQANAQPPSP